MGLYEVTDYIHKLSTEASTLKISQRFQPEPFTRHLH
jgi:hypothetical protein